MAQGALSFCYEGFPSEQRVGDNHTPTFTGDSSVCTWELLVFKLPDYQITQLLNPFGALGDTLDHRLSIEKRN